jgi:hypothetical protein
MTPTINQILNDEIAPDDLKNKLKCAIMELTDKECAEILEELLKNKRCKYVCNEKNA